ncbi:DUF997 family protein [Salmonella enterica subsp. enterica serovar Kentucky]|nr:DUF997 family protein [Salmonella enterica subsp. enterica serovar Kentucky]
MGEEEVALTRQKLGWHHPAFEIPKEIYRAWDGREKGEKAQQCLLTPLVFILLCWAMVKFIYRDIPLEDDDAA